MSLNYSQLPSWLENSKIFRKLFILRKLYLTKTSFRHYSQFAEDVTVGRLFPKSFKGFFVDVGCFHPKKYNNTYRLYKKGWRGINIDIDPIKIEGFNLVRPKDTNIATAVGNIDGEMEYYSNGFYSLTSSLDQTFAEKKFRNSKKEFVVKKTPCHKLTTLIEQTDYKDREIDFLSVDAEGYDIEVLKSLDFEKYKPKLIAVESHHQLFYKIQETDVYKFLTSLDYTLVGWCGLSLIMANKSFQNSIEPETE